MTLRKIKGIIQCERDSEPLVIYRRHHAEQQHGAMFADIWKQEIPKSGKKSFFVKFISILNSLKHQKINLLCLVECICHAHYSCRGKWALMNSVLFLQNTCCSWVSLSWRQQYRKCLFPQRVFQIAVVMLNWFWCGRWGNTPEVNWLFMLGTLPRLPFLCP